MNIANKLTIFRVILIPFFMFFFLTTYDMGSFSFLSIHMDVNVCIALVIFVIASVTDWLDGYLARKHNFVTNFGKFMDPLADKILVTAALVSMIQLQWIPAWAVIIILAREFSVTGLRLLISSDGSVMAAKSLGKLKTVIQMVTIIIFFFAPHSIVADIGLYITVFITVYSGWDYFKAYLPLLNPNH